ncbi:MAG: hypothetical protein WBP66_10785, partial [Azonexus sp.]
REESRASDIRWRFPASSQSLNQNPSSPPIRFFLGHYDRVNRQREITPFADSVDILTGFSGSFA